MPKALLARMVGFATVTIHAQRPSRDYVQWRGAQRDGSASAFVEPTQWPDALTRRWKVDVGEGYGTPLIVGDVAYVFTRVDGQGGITALDAATGRQRWRTSKAGKSLFLLNDDGELIVARGNRKAFAPIVRYTVAESATWAQPAISGERIFIKDVNTLALWTVR